MTIPYGNVKQNNLRMKLTSVPEAESPLAFVKCLAVSYL